MQNSCNFSSSLANLPHSDRLFKLVNLEDFVFRCSRQVALHNSVILLYCYLTFIISWRFFLIEINCFTLVSIIIIIFPLFLSPSLPLSLISAFEALSLSFFPYLLLQRKLWIHFFFMRNLLHAHRCSPKTLLVCFWYLSGIFMTSYFCDLILPRILWSKPCVSRKQIQKSGKQLRGNSLGRVLTIKAESVPQRVILLLLPCLSFLSVSVK